MHKKVRVVHYVNQFFGQIGGEKSAGIPPRIKEGPIGSGMLLQSVLRDRGQVVATVMCGDNYFSSCMNEAKAELVRLITSKNPDLVIAGPAFNAGRYGVACGEICKSTGEQLGIPCVTGMFKENPGVELYRKFTYIIETSRSVREMKNSLTRIVGFALKLFKNEAIGVPSEEGYFPRGIRKHVFSQKWASERVIDMLMLKLSGNPYITEVSNPSIIAFEPAPPIADISSARIALVTEGGLVPKGNPDRIESSRCTKFGRYRIWSKESYPTKEFECIHRGFDVSFLSEDPNRLLPIDILIEMEEGGHIAKLSPFFYSTCGTATFIDNAKRIGQDIAKSLKNDDIHGVIVAAT